MPVSPEFLDFLVDQLASLGPVQSKRMFGGAGLFMDGTMFGLVVDDGLYLKADDENRPDFEALDLGPFTYKKKTRKEPVKLSYFEAPSGIAEDQDDLCEWGRKAWEAARRAAK
ncbi:MAG: TfoX/Sxy family protein [Rhodospirillales bacterium]|nr:TfoX/Sxy family protein [Rhodospirillales bacterium]